MVPSFMLSHRQILRLFTTLIRFMRTASQALATSRLSPEAIYFKTDKTSSILNRPLIRYVVAEYKSYWMARIRAIWAVGRKPKQHWMRLGRAQSHPRRR